MDFHSAQEVSRNYTHRKVDAKLNKRVMSKIRIVSFVVLPQEWKARQLDVEKWQQI